MDLNRLSPYIRIAMHSTLPEKCIIEKRIIYDYEIIYVQSGSCYINVDGTDYLCTAGKIVFLRPGIPHSFRVPDNCKFCQPHIHFDAVYNENSSITPVSFKDYDKMSKAERLLISNDIFKDINIPTVFESDSNKEFKKLFFELISNYSEGKKDIVKYKALMLEILRLIINQFSANSDEIDVKNSVRLKAVKEYVDANFMHNISLEDIASYFSFNKYTLLRGFKNMYGDTIISYCNKRRMETSEKLLTETTLTVKEISEILNFTDEYTFSRFFKNNRGVSPSSFRECKRQS